METFTQKWAIISLLEDTPEGSEFYYTDFPLNVTLAGVFAVDRNGQQLVADLTELLSRQPQVEIEVEEKDMFGPKKNVAVMKIKKTPELMDLYQHIHGWLKGSGAKYNSPEYQGDDYLPHSTLQKTGSLTQGEKSILRSVSLIDLYPNNDGYQRRIFKTIALE